MNASQNILLYQSKKEEKLLLTQLDHNKRTLEELIEDSRTRTKLHLALKKISEIVEKGATKDNEAETKHALELVRDTSIGTFDDLSEALKNTMYGVSGNIVFQWLQHVGSIIV